MILMVASSTAELQNLNCPIIEDVHHPPQLLTENSPMIAVPVGVGLIQAALNTYEAIVRFHPQWVVGVGSCCAISPEVAVGALIIPSTVIHYGMDLRRFGLQRGVTFSGTKERIGALPVDSLVRWPHDGVDTWEGVRVWQSGTLGSADRFSTSADSVSMPWMRDTLHLTAIDMESYAMVAAARQAHTPISIIRTVSDTWSGERAASLSSLLKESSVRVCNLLDAYGVIV
jgi:adenosylhomocysteine nucleosidase